MNKTFKCLIVDEIHPVLFLMLPKEQFEIDYFPAIKRDEILSKIHLYEALVIRSKTLVDEDFLAKATNLKVIARAGAGMDLVDEEACKKLNIKLYNASEANKDAVGDHTLGLILALLNKIVAADSQMRSGVYEREPNRARELSALKVGIIGYGNMGEAVAKRLKGFGCKILVYDKYKTGFATNEVKQVDLKTFFENVDIVSLHIPLTEETHHLVDSVFVDQFKNNIYLINTARGAIVETSILSNLLKAGKILGLGLDVLENEKFSTYTAFEKSIYKELISFPNVILTPHVAGWSEESYEKISIVLAEKLHAFAQNLS